MQIFQNKKKKPFSGISKSRVGILLYSKIGKKKQFFFQNFKLRVGRMWTIKQFFFCLTFCMLMFFYKPMLLTLTRKCCPHVNKNVFHAPSPYIKPHTSHPRIICIPIILSSRRLSVQNDQLKLWLKFKSQSTAKPHSFFPYYHHQKKNHLFLTISLPNFVLITLKAYSLMLNRGRSQNFQILIFLHIFVALL